MKIVLLSTSDITGGAAIVSLRLVKALREAGHDARMLVLNRRGERCKEVLTVRDGVEPSRFPFYAERLEIFLRNGFHRGDLFKVSTASCGHYVSQLPVVKEADVILLGWVNQGFLSLKEIGSIASGSRPVVWTMHDQWCMTGICHLSGSCRHFEKECGYCPLLHRAKGKHDLSWLTHRKKQKLYEKHKNISFVAVSNWLARRAAESSLLGEKDVAVIPNVIEIPSTPALNTSERPAVIVMGAARIDEDVKNLPLAIEALNILYSKHADEFTGIKVVFFGGIRNEKELDRCLMPKQYTGPLDSVGVAEVMNTARVVLSTSRFEMLPTTIVEGLAWGCVAVATSHGGQSDIIVNGENGFLVDDDPESVALGLYSALKHNISPQALRSSVEEKFSASRVVGEYMNVICSDSKKS